MGGIETMAYDESNIFAKILRGEIPCDKVYEDEHVLAFRDINPQTPTQSNARVSLNHRGTENQKTFHHKGTKARRIFGLRATGAENLLCALSVFMTSWQIFLLSWLLVLCVSVVQ